MDIERVRSLCARTDWGSLQHAYGFATDIPWLLEELAMGGPATRKRVFWELWGNVFHQGTRYSASPAALSVIVEMATDPSCPVSSELLNLSVGLLLGFEEQFIVDGYAPPADAAGGLYAQLQSAFDAKCPAFVHLLDAPDAPTRAAAARCLGWVRAPAADATSALRRHIAVETSPEVRATLLFALSLLGSDEDAMTTLSDESPLVRAFAGLAIVRLRRNEASAEAKAAALTATTLDLGNAVPFMAGEATELASAVVRCLDDEEMFPIVVQALSKALRAATPSQGLALAERLIEAAFPDGLEGEVPSDLQVEALRALAETDVAWLIANIEGELTSAGLPQRREDIAELAGVELAIEPGRMRLLAARVTEEHFPDKALESYEQLAAGDYARDASVWRAIALLREKLGGDALGAWHRVSELDPDAKDALWALVAGDEPGGALQHLERLLALGADRADVALARARRLLDGGQLAAASESLEEAASCAPASAEVLLTRGELGEARGDFDEAERSYRRATELAADRAHVWASAGSLALRRGKFADAIGAFERAIELDPDLGPAYADLASAYRGAAREDDAVRILERAAANKLLPREAAQETADTPAEIVPSELESVPRPGPSPSGRVEWLSLEGSRLRFTGGFDQVGAPSGCSSLLTIDGDRTIRQPWPVLRGGYTHTVVADGHDGFVVGGEWSRTGERSGGGLVRISGSGEVDPVWLERFSGVTCLGLALQGDTVFAVLRGGTYGNMATLVAIALERAEVVWHPKIDGAVTAIAMAEGLLVVGGSFSRADGEARLGLAAFDPTTRRLLTFTPPALGRAPGAIAITPARVYVGFTRSAPRGGETSALLAFDRATGEITWRPDLGPFRAEVQALAIRERTIVVGGRFTLVEGARRNALCAFSLDDHRLLDWAPAPDVDPAPHPNAVLVWGAQVRMVRAVGDDWIVAGEFDSMGGSAARGLARLDASGRAKPLALRMNGRLTDFAYEGGRCALVGAFSMVNEPPADGAAELDLESSRVEAWRPSDRHVSAGAHDARGTCTLESAEAYPHATRIVYRGTDGEWESSANANVARALLDGDRLWLAGAFTRVGGAPRHYLACLDRATGAPLPFHADLDKPASCIARVADSLLVGGQFQRVGGRRSGSLVCLDARDGALQDVAFRTSGRVNDLVTGERHIAAFGRFTTESGPLARNALLLDRATLAATGLPLALRGLAGEPTVDSAFFHGDRLIVTGAFTHVNGIERSGVAEIDLEGRITEWAPKLIPAGTSPVTSFAVNERVMALAGSFSIAGLDRPMVNLAVFDRRARPSAPAPLESPAP